MRFGKVVVCLLLPFIILYSSCKRPEQYSLVPEIAFKDFTIYGDSANLAITFKDGDGNIGLNDKDTSGSFAFGSPYYYNIYLIYYYKGPDGNYYRYVDNNGDLYQIPYRIKPDITPKGKNKSISGEFLVKMGGSPAIWHWPEHHVIKYEIYIYDRALNKSNVITTPEITLP
jgi:hypothetical protein